MAKLGPRVPRFSAKFRRDNPAARAFHATQRDYVKQPMPPRAGRAPKRGRK